MLYLELDRSKKRSMTEQIYQQLRGKVINGELGSGVRLPSSRALSEELCVSRNTVLNALDMLVSEGLLESRIGSGVFVSAEAAALCKAGNQENASFELSYTNLFSEPAINFDSGIPALDHPVAVGIDEGIGGLFDDQVAQQDFGFCVHGRLQLRLICSLIAAPRRNEPLRIYQKIVQRISVQDQE